MRRADFNNDSYVQEFGLTISNNMMEVRGRVLPPPKLQYGGRVSSISGQVSFNCFLSLERDGLENVQISFANAFCLTSKFPFFIFTRLTAHPNPFYGPPSLEVSAFKDVTPLTRRTL